MTAIEAISRQQNKSTKKVRLMIFLSKEGASLALKVVFAAAAVISLFTLIVMYRDNDFFQKVSDTFNKEAPYAENHTHEKLIRRNQEQNPQFVLDRQ